MSYKKAQPLSSGRLSPRACLPSSRTLLRLTSREFRASAPAPSAERDDSLTSNQSGLLDLGTGPAPPGFLCTRTRVHMCTHTHTHAHTYPEPWACRAGSGDIHRSEQHREGAGPAGLPGAPGPRTLKKQLVGGGRSPTSPWATPALPLMSPAHHLLCLQPQTAAQRSGQLQRVLLQGEGLRCGVKAHAPEGLPRTVWQCLHPEGPSSPLRPLPLELHSIQECSPSTAEMSLVSQVTILTPLFIELLLDQIEGH